MPESPKPPCRTTTIDRHIEPASLEQEMRTEIRRALQSTPKALTPKWLYDERGSEIFDEITRLSEYYPTEAERSILTDHAEEIATHSAATTIIELGSGTSDKTRTLLDAFDATGQLDRFVPFDVSEAPIREATAMLATRYPNVHLHAVVGDFHRHLNEIPATGHRLLAFLGSTIGNFHVEERAAFLGALGDLLEQGEWLLLGMDLVKDVDRIIDAYNDASGVSEAFARNVLTVLNREFDGDIPVELFDYIPFWDPTEQRIDIRLRAAMPLEARLDSLDLDISFGEGEELRVEVSTKFTRARIDRELSEAGFAVDRVWTTPGPDGSADYGLVLARRA